MREGIRGGPLLAMRAMHTLRHGNIWGPLLRGMSGDLCNLKHHWTYALMLNRGAHSWLYLKVMVIPQPFLTSLTFRLASKSTTLSYPSHTNSSPTDTFE